MTLERLVTVSRSRSLTAAAAARGQELRRRGGDCSNIRSTSSCCIRRGLRPGGGGRGGGGGGGWAPVPLTLQQQQPPLQVAVHNRPSAAFNRWTSDAATVAGPLTLVNKQLRVLETAMLLAGARRLGQGSAWSRRAVQTLADPPGLLIVNRLAGQCDVCTCQLTGRWPSAADVSASLRVFEGAGLIEGRPRGAKTWTLLTDSFLTRWSSSPSRSGSPRRRRFCHS